MAVRTGVGLITRGMLLSFGWLLGRALWRWGWRVVIALAALLFACVAEHDRVIRPEPWPERGHAAGQGERGDVVGPSPVQRLGTRQGWQRGPWSHTVAEHPKKGRGP
jgi:hypothetical protein